MAVNNALEIMKFLVTFSCKLKQWLEKHVFFNTEKL